MNEVSCKFKKTVAGSILVLFTVMLICGTIFSSNAFAQAHEPSVSEQASISPERANVMKFGLLAASVAFGLGAIGAGIAISHVGAAAIGALAEKPEMIGPSLIFVALAEGLVVFGFVTALMILGKVS